MYTKCCRRSVLLLPDVCIYVEFGEQVEEDEAIEHGVGGEELGNIAVTHQQAQQERHDEYELGLEMASYIYIFITMVKPVEIILLILKPTSIKVQSTNLKWTVILFCKDLDK